MANKRKYRSSAWFEKLDKDGFIHRSWVGRGLPEGIGQPNDVPIVLDSLPAEQTLHCLEEAADAAIAVIGNGLMVGEVEAELFVLCPDAPGGLRPPTRF